MGLESYAIFDEIRKYKRRGPFKPLEAGKRTFPAALKLMRQKLTLYLIKDCCAVFLAKEGCKEKLYLYENIAP